MREDESKDCDTSGDGEFRSLVELLPVGVFCLDAEGHILFANDKWCRIAGLSKEEARGKVWLNAVHPLDRSQAHETWRLATKARKPFELEFRFERASGAVAWVLGQAVARLDARGEVVGYAGVITDISDRKEREDALLKSEEAYRELVNNANDILFRTDKDGRFEIFNPIAAKILGYQEEELVDTRYQDLIRADQRDAAERFFKSQSANKIPNTYYEFPAMTKSGKEVWFAQSTQLITDGEAVVGFQGVARDITERMLAEEALRLSEEPYRTLIDTAREGVLAVNTEAGITFINRQMAAMLGYEVEEMIGRSFMEFLDEENTAIFEKKLERRKQGYGEQYDLRFSRKDGSQVWGIVNATPLFDPDGRVVGSFGMITDVTDRKQADEELRRERERLSTILDGSPMPIFMIDRDHRVVFWNRGAEALTMIPRQESLGKTLRESLMPAYSNNPPQILADIVMDLTDEELLTRFGNKIRKASFGEAFEVTAGIWPGGEKRILDVIATRIRDHQGAITGVIQSAQDVTDKLRLQRQLMQSQKMEAIGTLAGGIAHDFNNILTSVIGYTEMTLRNLPEDSLVRKNLDQILKAGFRATDLVHQILAFSRPKEQERKPVHVAGIIKEALKLLRASLPTTIEIRQNIADPPESGIVMGDPTQIHQILMNLCTNAADAMRARGGILDVSLVEVEMDSPAAALFPDMKCEPYLRLTVSDTGHGMDNAVVERIFDPFFTTKEPGKGTGLGLAVAHTIVKEHGGGITVRSAPGEGTSFHVFLPSIKHRASREAEVIKELHTGNEHILFVDDEEDVVELACQMLESLGYRITAKAGSLEALAALRAEPYQFDVVISDQTMPHMTGAELAKEILKIRPDAPIILCTGFSETITPEMAKAIGIREFIMKPFAMRDLTDAIRRSLDGPEAI